MGGLPAPGPGHQPDVRRVPVSQQPLFKNFLLCSPSWPCLRTLWLFQAPPCLLASQRGIWAAFGSIIQPGPVSGPCFLPDTLTMAVLTWASAAWSWVTVRTLQRGSHPLPSLTLSHLHMALRVLLLMRPPLLPADTCGACAVRLLSAPRRPHESANAIIAPRLPVRRQSRGWLGTWPRLLPQDKWWNRNPDLLWACGPGCAACRPPALSGCSAHVNEHEAPRMGTQAFPDPPSPTLQFYLLSSRRVGVSSL